MVDVPFFVVFWRYGVNFCGKVSANPTPPKKPHTLFLRYRNQPILEHL